MKKGFTLIELLAVIVILAVLALIATPIVLNIIDDSKKNATLRSSENYLKAIEFSIAKSVMENRRLSDGTYTIMSNGSICIGTLSGNSCTDELVVEVSGETPESGNVTIKSRKIDSYEFTYKSGFIVVNGEIQEGDSRIDNLPALAKAIVTKAKNNNYYYTTTPDFSKATQYGEYGLYQAPDDYGTSYYFRGDTEDNYVQFGFESTWQVYYNIDGDDLGTCESPSSGYYKSYDFCINSANYEELEQNWGAECKKISDNPIYWRIIRVNGNGSIRLIYDGTEKSYNGVVHSSIIGFNSYNYFFVGGDYYGEYTAYYTNEYPDGYNGITSDNFAMTFIDGWYEENLKINYEKYISDSIFCNDIEIEEYGDGELLFENINVDGLYGAQKRIVKSNPTPSFKCLGNAIKNTVGDENGNGKLNNPVAIITADELVFSGNVYGINNKTNYLYSSNSYWTMSPAVREDDNWYNFMFYANANGEISFGNVNEYLGLRPVINLKSDVSFTGDGSYNNPYVIVTE